MTADAGTDTLTPHRGVSVSVSSDTAPDVSTDVMTCHGRDQDQRLPLDPLKLGWRGDPADLLAALDEAERHSLRRARVGDRQHRRTTGAGRRGGEQRHR